MRRRKKISIAIIVVIIIGIIAIVAGTMFMPTNNELSTGEKHILICALDESEARQGMGGCDMAFIVTLNNGSLVNYSAVYPGGLTHPTAEEPQEAQEMGAGEKLLMHDSFWYDDDEQSMKLAKEIVEYNLNVSIDAVVAVNTEAIDAVIQAASPIEVNGQTLEVSGIDIIREEQYGQGVTRGTAVLDLVQGIASSADDPLTKAKMVQAAMDQYTKGNIVMTPADEFIGLLASKGLSSLFG